MGSNITVEEKAIEAIRKRTNWDHLFIGPKLIYERPIPKTFWNDVDIWMEGYQTAINEITIVLKANNII